VHLLDGRVRRHLTDACLFSTVTFAGTNCQAVRHFSQPLHSCFTAIRCAERLFDAIAFELDLIAHCLTLEGARAVQALDSHFVLSIAAGELEKCSFWAIPLANPLVGCRSGVRSRRTRRNKLDGTRLAVFAARHQQEERGATN